MIREKKHFYVLQLLTGGEPTPVEIPCEQLLAQGNCILAALWHLHEQLRPSIASALVLHCHSLTSIMCVDVVRFA